MKKKQNILVTGGAGYIGSVLVPRLVKNGHNVTVLDNFWFWNSWQQYRDKLKLSGDNYTIIDGDITNISHVVGAMYHIDTVIHLACISNDETSDLSYDFTHNNSYIGTMNVIEAARANKVKLFIQPSSCSIYGATGTKKVTEMLKPNPLTQYAKIKLEIEHYLMYLYQLYNFPCVILRQATVCGYSPRQRLDLIINIFAHHAATKKEIQIWGGAQLRPSIHILDVVRAYEYLLTRQDLVGNTYNLGNENYSVSEWANITKKIIDKEDNQNIEITKYNIKDERSYSLHCDKIKEDLYFACHYSTKTAIMEVYNAIKTEKIKIDDYCHNMKIMQKIVEEF